MWETIGAIVSSGIVAPWDRASLSWMWVSLLEGAVTERVDTAGRSEDASTI